jgi:hypothetical protein
MTTFPNAPAPHGALFDNAPTVATPRPLCRDYVDGVVSIWANGRTQRGRCRADKVMAADDARTALEHGALQVFVMAGDVEAVTSGKAPTV